jgi:hypothetical protein
MTTLQWRGIWSHKDTITLLIAATHVSNLLALPTVNKGSALDLRALINQVNSNVNAIEALQLTTPLHEVIIGQKILDHLDAPSRKEWELASTSHGFPNLEEFIQFLEKRCRALELIQSAHNNKPLSKPKGTCKSEQKLRQAYVALNDNQCVL